MNLQRERTIAASAVLVFGLAALAVLSALHSPFNAPATIIGVVMTSDSDPRDQVPVSGASVVLQTRQNRAEAETDASGFFSLNQLPGVRNGQTVTLAVSHAEYKPANLEVHVSDAPVLVWLDAARPKNAPHEAAQQTISEVRIRYTVKEPSSLNVGTLAQTFQAVNTAGKACRPASLCSPDGRWSAAVGSITLNAPEDRRFSNVRASCIAGPCPFTRVDDVDLGDNGRSIHVNARSWSGTATFLLEADTFHTVINDMVRQSFPVIFGPSLSFTLPGTAAGPSIEAEMNGIYTVYPLGPALHISWATCSSKLNPDHSRLYSCELKTGYRFQ